MNNLKKKILISILLSLLTCNAFACDLTQDDKLKHYKISKKATIITKKAVGIVFLPIKPVKWIFNEKIQKFFPDNYVPEIISGTSVFTVGLLKEIIYDPITPGNASYCDMVANCRGIAAGIKE